MNTSITIAEFLIISIFTIVGYGVIKTAYDMWFKK